ncbi:Polysaccharide deacetylase [Limimonas halophila]|uniref:Chitooligosaccharide deacetylase n=1 Tax=Limimonas halophila TaxID=1082479 RepID=A0A1G7SL70_9PROT|nr:polysaccharide deacetylase family protein [Limimonas halophila]SDG23701.1 Polysaccharide deacetylase [Limimonas halophila]
MAKSTGVARALAAGLVSGVLAAGTAPAAAEETGGTDDGPAVDNGAVVLMYHRFGNEKYPSTNVRMEQFKNHVAELSKDTYTVLPLPAIVDALENNEPLPDHAVAITVDDAYESFFTKAWPLLKEAGLPVTLFAATQPIEDDYKTIMSWDQLETFAQHELGTVGNHTHTHAHMPEQSIDTNLEEIERSQALLKKHLGEKPDLFSYPYGEYSTDIAKLVAEKGFRAAVGQHSGAIGRTKDLLTLPRFAINEAYGGMDRFTLVTNSLPLPAEQVTPRERVLTPDTNPPIYGFTAHDTVEHLDSLSCYASGRGKVTHKLLGQRVEIRLDKPLREGRSRINCTMPTPSGRWRWLGAQFLVPTD